MRDHDDTHLWEAWTEAGHAGCGSWHRDETGPVVCCCGDRIITVTARDIENGRSRPAANPVALAAEDLGADYVVAGARTLYATENGWRNEYALPERVSSFLADWYDGKPVEPFSFGVGEPEFSYRWRPSRRPVAATRRAA